ncbi:tetraspanin-9-like, partial [Pollicipes pollicipes]|uniref:tetraspanin-9-like n=1 Tax=Pollicipes pollicipes TaxID=41117 RepID=UPI001884E592
MGGSGYGCVRHTFCLLNAGMWMAGCGLLGVGLWLRFAYGGYASLLSNYQGLSADGLCMAAGVIAAVIAFFGCCGACFQNRCLLMTYFSSVAFAFLLELI